MGRTRSWGGSGAYIFMFDPAGGETWKEVVKLELPGPLASGRPVGINGETAIVGSHTTPEHSAAYIFGRHQGGHDKWGLVKRLPEEGYRLSLPVWRSRGR